MASKYRNLLILLVLAKKFRILTPSMAAYLCYLNEAHEFPLPKRHLHRKLLLFSVALVPKRPDLSAFNVVVSIHLMQHILQKKNRIISQYNRLQRVDINLLSSALCLAYFRFGADEIHRLSEALRIPHVFVAHDRVKCSGKEALCIMLRRMTFPCRWVELSAMFGRSRAFMSVVVNSLLRFIHNEFSTILTLDSRRLSVTNLRAYSQAVRNQGGPDIPVFGFIDGTFNSVCRPTDYQRAFYSGHKKAHGIKFITICTPDGLTQHLYGPDIGSVHDARMLRESALLESHLRAIAVDGDDKFFILGDQGFPCVQQFVTPFRMPATPGEFEFNHALSRVRQAVEWSYKDISSFWKFLQHLQNLKVYHQQVAEHFWVGALLSNCRSCLYGSQTATFFNLQAPSLEEYLSTAYEASS